jgi:O-antigen ligase
MSAWPSQQERLSSWRRQFGAASHGGIVLVAFLGSTLLVRVLTDDVSSPNSRFSGSLNLSGVIAALFILVAIALLLRRHHGVRLTILAALWLCIWTGIAVSTRGASTETLREGVREASIVALAVIVYTAPGAVSVRVATRLVQLVGFVPALVAIYQLATHTGMDVAGNLRSNGTFAQPNSAVMFFAIATTASVWRYLDSGRRRSDVALTVLFAAAVVSTFSIDGLISMFAMMVVFGMLHSGSVRIKLVPWVVGGLTLLAFFATPLGSQRVSTESSTTLAAAERGEGSSLSWRLHKWRTLIPEWEASPLFGQGLGVTTTTDATPTNPFAGYPPLNEYVRYLVETGIIGLTILLGALALLLRQLVRMRRVPATLAAGNLNAATLAIAIVVGCLVNALADNTFLNTPTSYASALIVVAVLAYPSVKTQKEHALAPQAA